MTNREKINSMTDQELAEWLCDLINFAADKADKDDMCSLCPENKNCRRGNNGFLQYLKQETTDNA